MSRTFVNTDNPDEIRRAFQRLNSKYGPDSEVEFSGLILNGLDASRLIYTDGDKKLTSVGDLTSWIAGTGNEISVTDDEDGSITIALADIINLGASA